MTEREMIEDMLRLQEGYDQQVFKAHGISAYHAIDGTRLAAAMLDELGELNHELKRRWCWWKKTQADPDMAKVKEELADVVHFGLMAALRFGEQGKKDFLAGWDCGSNARFEHGAPVRTANMLLNHTLCYGSYGVGFNLHRLCRQLGFNDENVYEAYKAKNAINRQRVKDGY